MQVSSTLTRRRQGAGLRPESIVVHDWAGCDIDVEFDTRNPARPTVQKFLQDHLVANAGAAFILYDHRSGEAADFIVVRELPGQRLSISLYHCKGAGGPVSGERVDDVYELAGQSAKSGKFQRKELLLRHVERRTLARPRGGVSPFIVGNRNDALEMLKAYDPIAYQLSVYAVQPGLASQGIADNVRTVMAAANDSLTAQGVELRWMVSSV